MIPSQFEDCKLCDSPMEGIVDYCVREVCFECGGYSKVDNREWLEAARKRERGEAA